MEFKSTLPVLATAFSGRYSSSEVITEMGVNHLEMIGFGKIIA